MRRRTAATIDPARPLPPSARWLGNFAVAGTFTLLLFGFLMFTYPVGSIGSGTGSPVYQLCVIAVWVAALGAAQVWRNPAAALLPLALLAALAWCWLSVSWSAVPAIALRRVAQATIFASTAFLIIRVVGHDRTMAYWTWFSTATLVASFLLIALVPEIGVQQAAVITDPDGAGTWRGALMDKNSAGAFCSIFLLSLIFYPSGVKPALRVVLILATSLFLIKSGSKTSIGIIALAIPVAYLLARSKPIIRPFVLPLAILLILALAFGWPLLWAPFYEAIYHDNQAFTGRGYIWAATIAYIKDHWFLGAGFGSFWSTGLASPVFQYSDNEWVQERVFVGHNGYFDLLATIGLPGLILTLVAVFVIPFFRVVTDTRSNPRIASFCASVMIFCAGNNVTESTLLNGDALLNVMLMIVIAMLYVRPAAPADQRVAPERSGTARRLVDPAAETTAPART